jgi:hypothetical protein
MLGKAKLFVGTEYAPKLVDVLSIILPHSFIVALVGFTLNH